MTIPFFQKYPIYVLRFPLCFPFFIFLVNLSSCSVKNSIGSTIKKKESSASSVSDIASLKQSINNAEDKLLRNYKQKKLLFLKSKRYEFLYHKREDLSLREEVLLFWKEGKISDIQKNELLQKCDEIADLWRKQRKILTTKRFQLGFPN
jgi:hypothetical protein